VYFSAAILLQSVSRSYWLLDECNSTTLKSGCSWNAFPPFPPAFSHSTPVLHLSFVGMSAVPSTGNQSDSSPSSSSVSVEALLSALSALLSAELHSSSSQYDLLTDCNNIAAEKYTRLADKAQQLHAALHTLHSTHAGIMPYLTAIDALDGQLAELESAVTQLDLHSKALSEQFKELYR